MAARITKRDKRLLAILHAARGRAAKAKGERKRYDLDDRENLPRLKTRFATGRCEATGLPFEMKARRTRAWNSPSIDRIDSTRGYTYDNVRFVLWAINASLSDWGETIFNLIATAWLHQRAREAHDNRPH